MLHASSLSIPLALLGACSTITPPEPWVAGLAKDRSTIAFISTRHAPGGTLHEASQIYVMDGDGSNVRRLTTNAHADHFPALSPDGARIVFDSYRLRGKTDPVNTSDLFLMNADGSRQTHLTRGSSGTWSPDGRRIAFQASASGKGVPLKPYPGPAMDDSDIFVIDVHGLAGAGLPRNLTRNPDAIDDDPDWSPSGEIIVFTSRAVSDSRDEFETVEIYAMASDGERAPTRLTNNREEERAPTWSPDGRRIAFLCRRSGRDFELCTMNADGTGQIQLTDNAVADLTCSWSPDGKKIIFHRPIAPPGRGGFQLWTINADGTGEAQMTNGPGQNAFPNWSGTSATRAR